MGREVTLEMVRFAVGIAMYSPCQSKRGVAIYSAGGSLASLAYNAPPKPFNCTQDRTCRKTCSKAAVHAEQQAILATLGQDRRTGVNGLMMLHVKASNSSAVASGPPSCLECSKLILASGIKYMHLLHHVDFQHVGGCDTDAELEGVDAEFNKCILRVRRYSAIEFHRLTLRQTPEGDKNEP